MKRIKKDGTVNTGGDLNVRLTPVPPPTVEIRRRAVKYLVDSGNEDVMEVLGLRDDGSMQTMAEMRSTKF